MNETAMNENTFCAPAAFADEAAIMTALSEIAEKCGDGCSAYLVIDAREEQAPVAVVIEHGWDMTGEAEITFTSVSVSGALHAAKLKAKSLTDSLRERMIKSLAQDIIIESLAEENSLDQSAAQIEDIDLRSEVIARARQMIRPLAVAAVKPTAA
jgi:hypothetical protein